MSTKQLEQEIALCKLLLQSIAFAKQLCRDNTGSYMTNFLNEVGDRTAVQVSLLQEILHCSDEFSQNKAS